MKKFKNKDIVSGLFLIILTVGAWFSTNSFNKSSISSYGNPATVPRVIIIILFVFAIMIFTDGIKAANNSVTSVSAPEKALPVIQKLPEMFTYVLIAMYVALLKPVGFVITTAFYLFLQIFVLSCFNYKKCWQYALIALFVSPTLYYVFRVYFNVFLPAGILNWNP